MVEGDRMPAGEIVKILDLFERDGKTYYIVVRRRGTAKRFRFSFDIVDAQGSSYFNPGAYLASAHWARYFWRIKKPLKHKWWSVVEYYILRAFTP